MLLFLRCERSVFLWREWEFKSRWGCKIRTMDELSFGSRVPGTCQAWHYSVYFKCDCDALCMQRKRQTYSNVRAQSYESCKTRDCQAAEDREKTPGHIAWAFFFDTNEVIRGVEKEWGSSRGLRMTMWGPCAG